MVTRIEKWGNSQGVRVTRAQLEQARLDVGDEVEVEVRDGTIVVVPVRQVRGRHDLAELVARIPEDHEPGDEESDGPVGRELW
jgi:antitoxin MazE